MQFSTDFFTKFFHKFSPIFLQIFSPTFTNFFTDFSIQFLMWKNPQPKNIITNFIINVIMDGASSTFREACFTYHLFSYCRKVKELDFDDHHHLIIVCWCVAKKWKYAKKNLTLLQFRLSLKQPFGQKTTHSGNGTNGNLWPWFKGCKRKNPEENNRWCQYFKKMQPMWICLFCCKQFEETFENAQWRKVQHMQWMWFCILSGRSFEATFEDTQWRKVK